MVQKVYGKIRLQVEGKNQLIETIQKETQLLDLFSKDFSSAIIQLFKRLKITRPL